MKKKLVLAFAVIFIMAFFSGCVSKEISRTSTTKPISLTEEELAYFNGDLFFNGDYLNIRNQFLSSLYDKPSEINLFQLFYCGSGLYEKITDEELAVMEKLEMAMSLDELPCPCDKISCSNMDEILTEYMNITLAETKKIGLGQFVCLSGYEAYYHFHGDTNYRSNINFSSGEREGNLIRLFYKDEFFGDGDKVLTLEDKNGVYLFAANQIIDVARIK